MPQAEVGSLRVTMALNAGEFDKGVSSVMAVLQKLGEKVKETVATMAGAFASAGVYEAINKSIDEWTEQQQAIRAVDVQLKKFGHVAGFTSKQLQAIAFDLQKVSVASDQDILKDITANMLGFDKVVGPVFQRAQEQANLLSIALGKDLATATKELGAALNDPINKLSEISDVKFSDAQKEQIKNFIKQNEVMKAQGIILDQIDKMYADVGKRIVETAKSSSEQASNSFKKLYELIGKDLEPSIISSNKFMSDFANTLSGMSTTLRTFTLILTGVATSLFTVYGAMQVLGISIGLAAGPVTALIAGISALTAATVAFWPEIKRTGVVLMRVFSDIFNYISDTTKGIRDTITGTAVSIGSGFKYIYDTAKQWLVDAFKPVIESVRWFVEQISALFGELSVKLGLGDMMKPVADNVTGVFQNTVDATKSFTMQSIDTIKQYWDEAGETGGKAAAEAAVKWTQPVIEIVKEATVELTEEQKKLIEQGVKLTEKLRSPYDIMIEKIKALQAAQAAGKITAGQYGDAQFMAASVAQNAYASMASDISNSLEAVFGESKAFAIVSAIINTYEAFTKALAAYPPPYSYAAAAAALVAGFAKVAAIKRTTKSGGGASGSTASGGAAASGATGQAGGGTGGGASQSLLVQGVNPGDLFTGEAVREIAGKLLDFQRDGGKVVFQ